jgi:hypothetical protein
MAAGDPSSEHGVAVVGRFLEEAGVPLGALLDEESVAAGHGGLLARLSRRGCQFHCPADPAMLLRVNLDGTEAVVRAAARTGVPRVVLTSSAASLAHAPTARSPCTWHEVTSP